MCVCVYMYVCVCPAQLFDVEHFGILLFHSHEQIILLLLFTVQHFKIYNLKKKLFLFCCCSHICVFCWNNSRSGQKLGWIHFYHGAVSKILGLKTFHFLEQTKLFSYCVSLSQRSFTLLSKRSKVN